MRERRFDVVVSWELVDEVIRVLRRPKLRRYAVDESQIEELVHLLTPMLPTVEYDVPVRDPKDAPVVAAALSGNADVIVSGDADLLDDASLRAWLRDNGVEVVTAVEFLDLLG